MKAKLEVNPIQVVNRLNDLFGVEKEQLKQVVFQGVTARYECTSHHPLGMPGTRCWGEATRALRDLLVPLGWSPDNTDNIASVFHPKRKIKIAVTNSDSGTGIEIGHPQPICEKGDGAQRAMSSNQGIFSQISFDGLNEVDFNAGAESFWYLCIHCGAEMVRAEILCPILNHDGLFGDFHERIALITDSDDNGGYLLRDEIPDSPDGGSDFEIDVTRKQA